MWNVQNRSSLAADSIKSKLGRYFIVPNATRWNSLFDATDTFHKLYISHKSEINLIMDKYKISRPTSNEIEFLGEYVQVMKPLATSLDILQGQDYMYMGYLVPTIKKLLSILIFFLSN